MDPQKSTLQYLAECAKNGDEKAFREIFERTGNKVFAYSLSRTATREDALDIVQETFIDLWRSLNGFKYQSDEALYGFIFTITKRKIARYHNKRRSFLPLKEELVKDNYELSFEDYSELHNKINSLGKKYSDLLRMRYWAGLTFAEIATSMGISEGAAKVRHTRAVQKLQNLLKNYE